MSKLLLTGAASAAAYKSKSVLHSYEVVLGDYMPLPPMPGLFALPSPNSAAYLHELLKFCLTENVTYLLPVRRAEVTALTGAKALFEEYGITVMVPDHVSDIPVFAPAAFKRFILDTDAIYWLNNAGDYCLFVCD